MSTTNDDIVELEDFLKPIPLSPDEVAFKTRLNDIDIEFHLTVLQNKTDFGKFKHSIGIKLDPVGMCVNAALVSLLTFSPDRKSNLRRLCPLSKDPQRRWHDSKWLEQDRLLQLELPTLSL